MIVTLSRRRAVTYGLLAIGAVVLVAAFNSFVCYKHDLLAFLTANALFVGPALVVMVICVTLPNPLRALGAAVLFVPWLLLAYYTDCIRPYAGGGASMIYVAVLFWGTPSAILGALLTGPLTRRLGIEVAVH